MVRWYHPDEQSSQRSSTVSFSHIMLTTANLLLKLNIMFNLFIFILHNQWKPTEAVNFNELFAPGDDPWSQESSSSAQQSLSTPLHIPKRNLNTRRSRTPVMIQTSSTPGKNSFNSPPSRTSREGTNKSIVSIFLII